jgi:hypothetical protein
MTPRLWSIVFHLHADATATVHVHVDSRRLLPSCESYPLSRALGYVEAVLVDVRPDDQLTLRLQSVTSSPQFRRFQDVLEAKLWLRERAGALRRVLGSKPPEGELEGSESSSSSGLRPALRDETPDAPAKRPFKAGS